MSRSMFTWLLTGCLASVVLADDAKQVFDSLYAQKVRAAQASTTKADDIALAGEMVEAAGRVDEPALLALLCDQAYALAHTTPRGHDTAVEALQIKAKRLPDKRVDSLEKITKLRSQMFQRAGRSDRASAGLAYAESMAALGRARQDAGDYDGAIQAYRRALAPAFKLPADKARAVKQWMQQASAAGQQVKRLSDLNQKLEANPGDKAAAKALALLYVVEQDDPGKATKYAKMAGDATLVGHVEAAVKPIASVDEQTALTLGEWYRDTLAPSAEKAYQPAMLNRAHRYYQVFLRQHPAKDFARTRVELAMSTVEKSLKALGLSPPALEAVAVTPRKSPTPAASNDEWFDLLPLVDPRKDLIGGSWGRAGAGFVAVKGGGRQLHHKVLVPVEIRGDYDLRYRFRRAKVASQCAVVFPVGDRYCTQNLLGRQMSLAVIDGKPSNSPDYPHKKTVPPQEGDTFYTVDIRVRMKDAVADISVDFEQEPVLKWTGEVSRLSTYSGWRIAQPRRLQLGAYLSADGAPVIFDSVQVRKVSGDIRPLRQPPVTQTGPATPGDAATDKSSGSNRSLVAHWTFDNVRNGVAKDVTGQGKDMTVSGAKLIEGRFGRAVQLDGVDDTATFPKLGESPAYSFAMWVRQDKPLGDHEQRGLLWADAYEVGSIRLWTTGRYMRFVLISRKFQMMHNVGFPAGMDMSQWCHIVGSYDPRTFTTTFYINGTAARTGFASFGRDGAGFQGEKGPIPIGHRLKLGAGRVGGSRGPDTYFAASIDDVRIYNRPLTQAEVTAIYKNQAPAEPAPEGKRKGLFEF